MFTGSSTEVADNYVPDSTAGCCTLTIFMKAFLRRILHLPPKHHFTCQRCFSTSSRMSSSGIAASLYAATISSPSITGAVPEESKEKRHHLKDGKGFTNPWVRLVPYYHNPHCSKLRFLRRTAGARCRVQPSEKPCYGLLHISQHEHTDELEGERSQAIRIPRIQSLQQFLSRSLNFSPPVKRNLFAPRG